MQALVDFSQSLRWQMLAAVVAVAAVAWAGGADRWLVAAWLALAVLVREARAATLVRLLSAKAEPIATRLQRTTYWTLALGMVQGASALLMLQLQLQQRDIASSAVLTMIMMSLCAGAVSTTYTVMAAFVAYAGAIAIPTALAWSIFAIWQHWAVGAGWQYWGIAALVLMFLGVQIRFARQNMKMFDQSYRMRLENTELLAQISQERELLALARDAAVQADLSKSRFLAAASHDLRQPLQSLSLNSGALLRQELQGESLQIAQEMRAGIDALRQMLDGLLDVSQIDAGAFTPHLQTVPLAALVTGLAAHVRIAAQAKGLRLLDDCPAGLHVVSDVAMLRRIVSNLLDNAIKYTERGVIQIIVRPDGPEHVLLTISDTGCGIPAADHARVFDDLVQVGNAHRDRTRGYGIGLGIVRRFTRMLGIEYTLASTLGEGTTITLRVPCAEGAGPVLASAARVEPGLVARRVLVLDDDEGVRRAYGHALQSLGCWVVGTATLSEALEQVVAHRTEIALVDFRLADSVDGLEAIAQLRRRWPQLAAILVSADLDAAMHEQARRLGVPCLHKPVTDSALAAAINGVLHPSTGRQRDASPLTDEQGGPHGL